LRAQPIGDGHDAGIELSRELDLSFVRDKIIHGQAIPTPETTLEELWQQLSWALDEHYA
jgi:hypothetical protein